MGFEVAYEIRDAGAGRGRGVFASRPIAAGALVWRFVEGENVTRHADEAAVRARLAALPSAEAARDWLDHAFFLGGALNEMHDDGIFFNHDEHNNTGLAAALAPGSAAAAAGAVGGAGPRDTVALRDIAAGEELLEDYGRYEMPKWYAKLCAEFESRLDYFVYKGPHAGDRGAARSGGGEEAEKMK